MRQHKLVGLCILVMRTHSCRVRVCSKNKCITRHRCVYVDDALFASTFIRSYFTESIGAIDRGTRKLGKRATLRA